MVYLIAAAFLLDLAVGDPRGVPHPVVGIGRLISFLEVRLRRGGPRTQYLAGAFLALLVAGSTAGLVCLVLLAARRAGWPFYLAGQVYFVYAALAPRGLAQAALRVGRALRDGDLSRARRLVGEVVGRDTGGLDGSGVSRAAVETVAENAVDAVVAPLFYAFLGGAPLCMAYRAVNTLDAMVGYKNERYRYLGWASARLDDLANYLPARLTGILLAAAASLRGAGRRAISTMLRFGACHPSPNSGVAEAAMAGALGVRLGGPVSYGGRPLVHPYLGDGPGEPGPEHIQAAVVLMLAAAVLTLAAAGLAALARPALFLEPLFHLI